MADDHEAFVAKWAALRTQLEAEIAVLRAQEPREPREPLQAQVAALCTQLEAQIVEIREFRAQLETLERRRAHERPIPITAEALDRQFDNGENIDAHVDWAHASRPGAVRDDLLVFRVTDMPDPAGVDGLVVVQDGEQLLMYRYLRRHTPDEARGASSP